MKKSNLILVLYLVVLLYKTLKEVPVEELAEATTLKVSLNIIVIHNIAKKWI